MRLGILWWRCRKAQNGVGEKISLHRISARKHWLGSRRKWKQSHNRQHLVNGAWKPKTINSTSYYSHKSIWHLFTDSNALLTCDALPFLCRFGPVEKSPAKKSAWASLNASCLILFFSDNPIASLPPLGNAGGSPGVAISDFYLGRTVQGTKGRKRCSVKCQPNWTLAYIVPGPDLKQISLDGKQSQWTPASIGQSPSLYFPQLRYCLFVRFQHWSKLHPLWWVLWLQMKTTKDTGSWEEKTESSSDSLLPT